MNSEKNTKTEKPLPFPAWESFRWRDMPENPLISPLSGALIKGVVGDPQILLPGEADERWHLFAWNNADRPGFSHFTSRNARQWDFEYNLVWDSGPFYVTNDGGRWLVYYTRYEPGRTTICVRSSEDLALWSDPETVLQPELDWEREGKKIQVRNPDLCMLEDGKFRLYYSAGTVWMDDMGFEEPKYIGVAESDNPFGPFRKRKDPIIGPDKKNPHRNHGAGALKIYRYGEYFLGILNGIYLDDHDRSRSALNVLLSRDGIDWTEAPYNPFLAPGTGWKKALVYQLDLRYYQGKLYLFYNARDRWLDGRECVGASVLDWNGVIPRKMWRLKK